MHFQNIKILWKSESLPLKDEEEFENGYIYPSDPEMRPSHDKINQIKSNISKILANHFSIETLDNNYGWLDHPEGQCLYG